jgi:hypothetical protein
MLPPLPPASSPIPEVEETRDQRRQRLRQQLLAQALPLIDQMADTLTDAPDRELFRCVEVRLRDLGQQIAASAHQAGLDDRKKGAT